MISILQNRVDNVVWQITQRNREIYALIDTGEFEGVEMKLGEADLEGFSEFSKEFFKILVNPRKIRTGEQKNIEDFKNAAENNSRQLFSSLKNRKF